MKRRDLFAGLLPVALAPLAEAQQQRVPSVGVLHGVSSAQWGDRMLGFHKGLGEMGYWEGRNLMIEYRWANGSFDRLPSMAAELVERNVDAICAGASDVAIRAAMAATNKIPIVFTTASNPVRAGFVESFNRPGANVTGATFMGIELVAKRVQLLKEVIPAATRIALLVNPNNPGLMQDNIQLSGEGAQRLGLELITVRATNELEIESAVSSAAQQRADALSIGNDAYLTSRSRDVSVAALRHKLPTMSESRSGVVAGLLMSYGPSQAETFRQAGLLIGRILNGQKPADLAVVQPTSVELSINLMTAKALGLTFPPTVLARADEVIE